MRRSESNCTQIQWRDRVADQFGQDFELERKCGMNRAVNYGLSKMQEVLGASRFGEEVAVAALCVPGCEHAPARAAGFALGNAGGAM